MKKSDLEQLVCELQNQVANQRNIIMQMKQDHLTELAELKAQQEESEYNRWCETNTKYLSRFMAEWVKENLRISCDEPDYSGYYGVALTDKNGNVISNDSSYITMAQNGLEE